MPVPGVRARLEAKAALDLEPGVAREVADVPEGVGLALEERDDDCGARRQGGDGALEEGHEEGLVVAHLTVDVGGLAADVGEVEDDAVEPGGPREGGGELGRVDVVEELVIWGEFALAPGGLVWIVRVVVVVFLVVAILIGALAVVLVVAIVFAALGRLCRGFFVFLVGLLGLGSLAANHSDVAVNMGVLGLKLLGILLQDSRSDIGTAMMLNNGRGEAQVTLADEQDAVVRLKGYRGLLVDLALLLTLSLLGAIVRLLLLLLVLLGMLLGPPGLRILMRQLPLLSHGHARAVT